MLRSGRVTFFRGVRHHEVILFQWNSLIHRVATLGAISEMQTTKICLGKMPSSNWGGSPLSDYRWWRFGNHLKKKTMKKISRAQPCTSTRPHYQHVTLSSRVPGPGHLRLWYDMVRCCEFLNLVGIHTGSLWNTKVVSGRIFMEFDAWASIKQLGKLARINDRRHGTYWTCRRCKRWCVCSLFHIR